MSEETTAKDPQDATGDFSEQTITFLTEQGVKAWAARERHGGALALVARMEQEMGGEAKAFERMFEMLAKLDGKNPGAYDIGFNADSGKAVIRYKQANQPVPRKTRRR